MSAADRPVATPKRPIYLNLFAIRQPIPAVVSILHRVSGALLFLVGIPLVLTGVQASLASAERFAAFEAAWSSPIANLVLLALVWAYLHHLLAGLRHLVLDVHIGLELRRARLSAALTLVLALLVTLAIGMRLW
jgi:succinate dehydrogenase / fumarate reductase cytochrome b subunit